jgi:Chalcone isomerase-like
LKAIIFSLLTCTFCFSSLFLYGVEDVRDNSTGESFPSEISFDDNGKSYKLEITGVATRKKFFVKVYSVAHYLQDANKAGADKFAYILEDDKAKQLTIKWVHEASSGKIQDGYIESFKGTLSSEEYAALQSDINKYVQFFNQDARKGDEHVLRWLPGGDIEVIINGQKVGSITNSAFAKGLWSVWFGDKSVVNKNNLTSLLK